LRDTGRAGWGAAAGSQPLNGRGAWEAVTRAQAQAGMPLPATESTDSQVSARSGAVPPPGVAALLLPHFSLVRKGLMTLLHIVVARPAPKCQATIVSPAQRQPGFPLAPHRFCSPATTTFPGPPAGAAGGAGGSDACGPRRRRLRLRPPPSRAFKPAGALQGRLLPGPASPSWPAPLGSSAGSAPGSHCDAPGGRSRPLSSSDP
jgi:hypothetical protein